MHDNRKVAEILSGNGRAIRGSIRIKFQEIGIEVYTSRVHSSKLMSLLLVESGQSDSNIWYYASQGYHGQPNMFLNIFADFLW